MRSEHAPPPPDRAEEPAPHRRWNAKFIHLPLLLILALSAFIQFSIVIRTTSSLPMVSDAADYFSYAYNLKHFGVYSRALTWSTESPPTGVPADSLRSPGYPLFLLAIPGLDTSAAYLRRVGLAQAVLAVLSVWLVFLIAQKFLPPGWSHAAAALTAISPHLANLSNYLLTESLFLFLLLASIKVSLWALRSRRTRAFFAAGLVWGLCGLVRPTVLPLPPLLLLAAFVLPALRSYRLAAVLLFAGSLVVQTPWWVRNWVTPLDPAQGSLMVATLHHGSYPGFVYQDRPETYGWPYRFDPAGELAERDLGSALRDIGRKLRDDPLTLAKWYLLGKPGTFLSWGYVQGSDIYVYDATRTPYRDDALFAAVRLTAFYLHWPLMLLGLGGAFVTCWKPAWLGLDREKLLAARVVSAIALYAVGFHMIAAPFPRYGVPFRPLLYILALALASVPFQGNRQQSAGVTPPASKR